MCREFAALFVVGLFGLLPATGFAQGLPSLGTRATALGAFVAVADDASAAAWNPAGLVNGPIFNILLDFGRADWDPDFGDPRRLSAGRSSASVMSFGLPPLGLTYYRLHAIQAERTAASAVQGRQDRQVAVRSLVTTHVGATVLQSLTDGLTVGATVKLVRGRLAADVIDTASWSGAFARVDSLEGVARTTADADVGVLYAAGRMRVGLAVRNVSAPRFDDGRRDGAAVALARHARAGVAWGSNWPGMSRLVLALDADLTEVPQPDGPRRDVAVGVERWWRAQRLGVRGGLRASGVGEARPVVTIGGSVAIRQGLYVDTYAAGGRSNQRGWGMAARLAY